MAKVKKCSVVFSYILVTVARVFFFSLKVNVREINSPVYANGKGPIQGVYVPRQIFVGNGRLL